MGKSADIEKIKYRATYYNNCAVGAAITGFLVPYLSLIQRFGDLKPLLDRVVKREVGLESADVKNLLIAFGTIFLALALSRWLRYRALVELSKLPD